MTNSKDDPITEALVQVRSAEAIGDKRMKVKDRTFVRELGKKRTLYRDPETGLAWIEDARTHTTHCSHPRVLGSVTLTQPSLQKSKINLLTGWLVGDHLLFADDSRYIYNLSRSEVVTYLDAEAARNCDCAGNHNIPPQWHRSTDRKPVTKEILINKRTVSAKDVSHTETMVKGIVARIYGFPGSYTLQLLDARYIGENNAIVYNVACSRTIDGLFGVYDFLAQASAEIVIATLENSIV